VPRLPPPESLARGGGAVLVMGAHPKPPKLAPFTGLGFSPPKPPSLGGLSFFDAFLQVAT